MRTKPRCMGLYVQGFRVAEPRHAGTSGWQHLLIFMPPTTAINYQFFVKFLSTQDNRNFIDALYQQGRGNNNM